MTIAQLPTAAYQNKLGRWLGTVGCIELQIDIAPRIESMSNSRRRRRERLYIQGAFIRYSQAVRRLWTCRSMSPTSVPFLGRGNRRVPAHVGVLF